MPHWTSQYFAINRERLWGTFRKWCGKVHNQWHRCRWNAFP